MESQARDDALSLRRNGAILGVLAEFKSARGFNALRSCAENHSGMRDRFHASSA